MYCSLFAFSLSTIIIAHSTIKIRIKEYLKKPEISSFGP